MSKYLDDPCREPRTFQNYQGAIWKTSQNLTINGISSPQRRLCLVENDSVTSDNAFQARLIVSGETPPYTNKSSWPLITIVRPIGFIGNSWKGGDSLRRLQFPLMS